MYRTLIAAAIVCSSVACDEEVLRSRHPGDGAGGPASDAPAIESGSAGTLEAGSTVGFEAGSALKPEAGSPVPDAGSTIKQDQGSTVKSDKGSTVKPDQGSTVKQDAGSTVKPDQGSTIKPDAAIGPNPGPGVYFVAPTGKDTWSGKLPDTNSGGTDGPFATVTKARDAVKALRQSGWTGGAITVYLRGGVYTILAPIAFASGDSGSASAPITYRAYPGEKPVLQGGRRITGFTALGNGRYSVKPGNGAGSSWYFRELFVGGKRMIRARYPNYVASNPHRGGFLYAAADGSTTSFKYAAADNLKSAWVDADAEVHIYPGGEVRAFESQPTLAGINETSRTVTMSGRECTDTIYAGDRYYIANVLALLDAPGEWYLGRDGTLTLWPEGTLTGSTEVVAPVVPRIIQASNAQHLAFEGLTFEDTDYSRSDETVAYAQGSDAVVRFDGSSSCRVSRCRFRNIGKWAVALMQTSSTVVSYNQIEEAGEGGVMVEGTSAKSNQITDNVIQGIGRIHKHISGVLITGGAASNTVAHNRISDSARYGIALDFCGQNNVVEANDIFDVSTETYDTGAIESYFGGDTTLTHNIIRGNLIHDLVAYGGESSSGPIAMGWCIYIDGSASGYTIENNVAYGCGGVMFQGGNTNVARNNIFVDDGWAQSTLRNYAGGFKDMVFEKNILAAPSAQASIYDWLEPAYTFNTGQITIDYNLYWSYGSSLRFDQYSGLTFAKWQSAGFDPHGKVADPLFVDRANHNYALKAGSPALALGFKPIDLSTVGPRP